MFNKICLTIILGATTLMISTQSFAGQDGNGGFGIQCGNKLETLDLYEAKYRYNYTVDLGAPNLTVADKVNLMLNRLAKFQPSLAMKYKVEVQKFFKLIENGNAFLDGKSLVLNEKVLLRPDSPLSKDIGISLVCSGAKLIAIARNIKTENPRDQEIFLFRNYWNQLDNDSKATLLVHEIIYNNQFYMSDQTDSSKVRGIVALLASKDVETMTDETLIAILKGSDFIILEANGMVFSSARSYSIDFHSNGKLKTLLRSDWPGFNVIYQPLFSDKIVNPNHVIFDEIGRLTYFETYYIVPPITIGQSHFGISKLSVIYTESEPVYRVNMQTERSGNVRDQLSKEYFVNVFVNSDSRITHAMNASGRLLCARVGNGAGPYQIKLAGKGWKKFNTGFTYVKFDKDLRPVAFGCDPKTTLN